MQIKLSLLPTQKRFFTSDSMFPAYIGGYGAGKSYVGAVKAVILGLQNAGLQGLYVGPTYRDLRDTNVPLIRMLLDKWEIRYKINKSTYDIYLIDFGTQIMCRSADEPDSLKGPNVAWAGIDEIARAHEDVWGVLVSRVRHPDAPHKQCYGTGTPEGFNWVYERWVEQMKSGYELFTASSTENIFLDKEYVQHLKDALHDEELQQKLHGIFAASFVGRAYRRFNRAAHVTETSPFGDEIPHKSLTVALCCDFNVDPCVWVLLQHKNGLIYVFDEIVQPDTDTYHMAHEARQRLNGYRTIVYGDSAGKARSTAGKTDYAILQDYGFGRADVPPSNPPVRDSVNSVNKRLIGTKNGDGTSKPQLFIHPKCSALIRDLERVRWKPGANGILDKSDGNLTHASDALRYFVNRTYGVFSKPPPPKRVADLVRGR